MNCETHEAMMSALVDGALGPADAPALFTHLGTCRECQGYLRHLLRLRNAAFADGIEEMTSRSAQARTRSTPRPAANDDAGHTPGAAPRKGDPRARSLVRTRIQVTVPSAALALIIVVLWTLAISLTVFSDSGAEARDRAQSGPDRPYLFMPQPPGSAAGH